MELIIIAVIFVVGFGLFFFVLRRLLRLAIRLALFGAVIIALIAGGVAWWWSAPLGDSPGRNRNTSARPARTNR